MSVQVLGSTVANVLEVDANKNALINAGLPAHPASAVGGFYTVTGGCGGTGVVAAGLANDTPLMGMRFSASSTRKAYVTKGRILIGVATVGASAGVPGQLGLQRFNTAAFTGGAARTVNEMHEASTTATDMTDVRDHNATLTVGSVAYGTEVSRSLLPLCITSGFGWMEWVILPPYPIVLQAGDGLCLRTRVQLAATQTWVYTYTFEWYEA